MIVRLLRAVAAALLLVGAPSAAGAEERILNFLSDIAVQPDGSLLVTETIDVRSEGEQIRRGIYRDFPTLYHGRYGSRKVTGFELLQVIRDGAPEPARVEAIDGGVRIRIGDSDTLIGDGDHRYIIRYRTDRQVGRFGDFDELYWNVTGTGWAFPIDLAEARITLPEPAAFLRSAAYTGGYGATGRQARAISQSPGEIVFRTTAPLLPHEGLTVAAAWPKGVVADPGQAQQTRWWLADYGPLIVGAATLGGLVLFYWVAWKRAGRDPKPGTLVPLFSPPDDLTPPAMRYVWKMGLDNRAFAAALVDLGVKGHIRLVQEDGGWLSGDKTRIERLAGVAAPLPPAEEAMLRELAMSGESILMDNENHEKFAAARKALNEDFKKRFDGVLFQRNWGWALAGLALFFASVWAVGAAVALATGVAGLTPVLVSLGATVTAALFLLLLNDSANVGRCLIIIGAMIFGGIAMVAGVPVIFDALSTGWWWPFLPLLVGLPLVLSAFWWISAPTREGRKVLDRIAGFRQYLSIAEGERLDRLTPHERTPELFERFLPFAIALGVENRWADRFKDVLAAASVAQGQTFTWYSGSHSPWADADSFVDGVGSSLASSVNSASTAPGSGGGGFSGGGGGGGGGGGW